MYVVHAVVTHDFYHLLLGKYEELSSKLPERYSTSAKLTFSAGTIMIEYRDSLPRLGLCWILRRVVGSFN